MKNTTATEGGKPPFVALWDRYVSPSTTQPIPPQNAPWGANKTQKEAPTIIKPNRSLTDQVFGIGRYRYSKDGQLYFVHGNTRIKVKEHFCTDGKSLGALLEDLIQFSAKQQKNEIRQAC